MKLKVGQKYILKGNVHRMGQTKIHISAVIVDGERTLIVYKWYGQHKQWWHYEIKDQDFFEFWEGKGGLVKTKGGKSK